MSNFDVNIKWVLDHLPKKWVNNLTPIIEWIVNWINSIHERIDKDKNFNNWKVEIIINKEKQLDWWYWKVSSILIIDNWIWFNEENFNSFRKLYSEKKIKIWGKWFWRITYLKYFNNVNIQSIFFEKNKHKKIVFDFDINWPNWEKFIECFDKENQTIVKFETPNKVFKESFNEKITTIARKLSENLLSFLLNENCPEIILKMNLEEINLKEYVNDNNNKINKIWEKNILFMWKNFDIFVYEFHHSDSQVNSINLVAHDRVVTKNNIWNYIPEFKEIFVNERKTEKLKDIYENFVIKIYVKSKLFDDNVDSVRSKFDFPIEDINNQFSIEEIEKYIINNSKEFFPKEIKNRFNRKVEIIKQRLNNDYPRYKSLLDEWLNEELLNDLPNKPSNRDIVTYFNKISFEKEVLIWDLTKEVLDSDKDIKEKEEKLFKNLEEVSKNQLVHYICLRKIILDLFKKYLEYNYELEYEKETKIHNLIFPMWWTSYDTQFEKNNIWLIDENLIYSSDIISDKSIKAEDKKRTEPDIMVFREWSDINYPVYIIELKRPWRKNYDKNPIEQLAWYVDRLRNNKKITSAWRPINITHNTPIFCYFIWDLTEDVLKKMKISNPIELEKYWYYYLYNNIDNYYFYALSFDYIYKTANQRNKYFFKKLWIDI